MSELYCPLSAAGCVWMMCYGERCKLWNPELHNCGLRTLMVDISHMCSCLDNILKIVTAMEVKDE